MIDKPDLNALVYRLFTGDLSLEGFVEALTEDVQESESEGVDEYVFEPEPPSGPVTAKGKLLAHAAELVDGERNAVYGPPVDDFGMTARFWSNWLNRRYPHLDAQLTATDVAAMMLMLKLTRLSHSPEHYDSWVDAAGYAACGWDVVTSLQEREAPI